ncbi:MAG TPA: glycosyltransferase [Solirubrobacteraceae bacterium]|jgi:glycosyltransferase involved in cell wall biosynthesis|nr:glycosyltransferase [Solirubrobacteraceae bacterium]
MSEHLRIAVLAAARHPIREPFAGGLEAHVHSLAVSLAARGHDVVLFGGPGSEPLAGVRVRGLARPTLSAAACADASMTSVEQVGEHHAYLRLMLELSASDEFDVIHNHSLHYLPIAMAPALSTPMITTLHTPPTPWLESAIQATNGTSLTTFVAVSRHTARAWSHLLRSPRVVHNGVDLERWRPGPGGGPPIWFGRITPEKGTHLAIEAAEHAEEYLSIAGPVSDRDYFDFEVKPRLNEKIRYLGHLSRAELARHVGRARTALITPCWEEPYGLVVMEALACGTPVCGFDRGALAELVDDSCARLVAPDDARALAKALPVAASLARSDARARAERAGAQTCMIASYERLYAEVARERARA